MVSVPCADAVEHDTRVCLSCRRRWAGADDCVGIGQFGTVVGDGPGCVSVHHDGSSDLLVVCLCIVLHAVGAAMARNAPRGYACV